MESLKFLDLFAGVGGFRLGMEEAGHRCLGFCEIDKFARTSYKAIHDTTNEVEMHDITAITDEFIRGIGVGEVDVICGGFPCQAFSIAGNRGGFDDARGTLFFEIARFASILKPKLLFLENVTGLLNHEGGATFETIIRALDEIGYDCEWDCINSKDYICQNRDRVFIIGHLRGERTRKVFPFAREGGAISEKQSKINVVGSTKGDHQTSLGQREIGYGTNGIMGTLTATDYKGPKQIAIPVLTPDGIEKRQNGRRFKDNNDEMFTLTAQDRHGVVVGNIQSKGFKNNGNIYSTEGIAPTVTTRNNGDQGVKILQTSRGYNKGGEHDIAPTVSTSSWQENNFLKIKEATKLGHAEALPGDSVNISHPKSKTRRGRVGKQIANTLLTGEEQAVITDNFRIRKLTPRECWRLQGFPDWAFEKAATVNSNSQLYKQAGNSVTVPVIYEIAKRLEVYA